jgi:hypothetical protein
MLADVADCSDSRPLRNGAGVEGIEQDLHRLRVARREEPLFSRRDHSNNQARGGTEEHAQDWAVPMIEVRRSHSH